MADIVTGTVTGQVDESAVLRDIGTLRREQAVGVMDVNSHVKDSGWQNLDKTATVGDRVTDQGTAYFISSQNINFANATALAALKAGTDANFNATLAAIQLTAANNVAAIQLSEAKNAAASALAAAATQAIVTADGNATRSLINSQTIDELRFAKLHEELEEKQHRGCGERKEGVFTYGPPTGATFPV